MITNKIYSKKGFQFFLGNCEVSCIMPVWLNGWVFVYGLSGCGFESSWSHLNLRFCACFEQGVPWYSGNYGVCIHSETCTWHDKNKYTVKEKQTYLNIFYFQPKETDTVNSFQFLLFKKTLQSKTWLTSVTTPAYQWSLYNSTTQSSFSQEGLKAAAQPDTLLSKSAALVSASDSSFLY